MKKKQGFISIASARDNFFFTKVLDGLKEAASIFQVRLNKDTDNNKTSQIFLVKDIADKPIGVLKTICCPDDDNDTILQAREEFELAKRLGSEHSNIAKGIDIQELISEQMCCVEMLMEYGGENLLEQNKMKGFTGIELINIAMQTASAMEFSHKKCIFHSDIKPENIVYKDGIAKVIDFGVSMDLQQKARLKKYTETLSGNILGVSPAYCPPEMFNKGKIQKIMEAIESYSKSKAIDMAEQNEILKKMGGISREMIDVYLWGMTFYQLLSKKTKETIENEREMHQKSLEDYAKFKQEIKKLKFEGEINERAVRKFIQVLEKCLNYASSDRPTFEEINNDYMSEIKEIIDYKEAKKEEKKIVRMSKPVEEEKKKQVTKSKI